MGRFFALLLIWLIAAAPAQAQIRRVPYPAFRPGFQFLSIGTFPAPTPAPIASTFLGYDNVSNGATTNNGLSLASGATIPPTVPSSWWWIQKFKYDDQAGNTPTGAASVTLAAACTASSCSDGSARFLQVSNPFSSATLARQREVLFAGKRSSNSALWLPPSPLTGQQTGINLVAGVNYCIVVQQLANGIMWVSANDSTGAPASGSPSVSVTVNNTSSPGTGNYYYNTGTGTPAAQTNLFNTLGTTVTATTAYANGTAGPLGDVAFGSGAIPNTANVPSAAVLTSLCDGSKTPNQWASDNGLTITSHYPLNNPNASPPTSFAADPTGSFTTVATVIAGDSSKIIPASPLTPLPCLTLAEKGPFDIAPLDAGQLLVGQILVRGTISAASCGATPTGVEAQAINIGTGLAETGWTTLTLTGNTYSGYLTGVPASTTALSSFHRISVRIKNSPTYILAGQYPIGIGYSYLRVGQSQVAYMMGAGTNGGGTGSQLVGNGSLTTISMGPTDSTDVQSNKGQGQPSMVQLDAVNNPGGGAARQIAGDGIVEEAQDLSAYLNVPVKVVSISKAGQASDAWAEDYQPQIATLTGSGTGAYASTSLFATASPTGAGGALAFVGVLASVNTAAGPQMSVLKGAVTLVDANGATVATDSTAPLFSLVTTGNTASGSNALASVANLTGVVVGDLVSGPSSGTNTIQAGTYVTALPGGGAVTMSKNATGTVTGEVLTFSGLGTFTGANISTGGTIDYLTGAISGVTFTGSQVSPLKANWTEISDTQAGSYAQQSPYVPFPTFGDGVNSASGYTTQVLNQNYQPFNAIVFEQCTSDAGSMLAPVPPPNNNSGYNLAWQTKWRYVLETKLSTFPWWRGTIPTLVLGYGRDSNPVNNVSACRQALLNFGSIGSNYIFAGSYYDDLTQCTGTILCLSPHEGPWVLGGRRFGRRGAANLCAKAEGSTTTCTPSSGSPYSITESQITSAVRAGTTITFTVNNTGNLTNCGTNLSGGSDTPSLVSNTCSPPGTPVGTHVYGMAFGPSSGALFNFQGANWQNNGTAAGVVDDTKTHDCVITGANTFACTAPWFTSGIYWSWVQGGPFQEAGSIQALSVTPGVGYTGSGATVTGTGATNAPAGTCTHATASIHQSGGLVTASRVTVGTKCVGTDTFALTGLSTGTGGAVSGVYYAPQDDHNKVGQVLYDDQGGCGGTVGGVVYEPGCLVAPVAIPQGPLT